MKLLLKFIFAYSLLCTLSIVQLNAQTLSLDSCRSLALANNKELKISQKEIRIAEWQKKIALSNYYPKISALGSYMRNQKEISLLSDTNKEFLRNLGTHTGKRFQQAGQLLLQKYPNLAPVLQEVGTVVQTRLVPALDEVGNSLLQDLRTDTRNLYVGALNLTQPIFIGGKVRAYNNITNYKKRIATSNNRLTTQEVLLQTDKAYWLVVSLSNKKNLADSYLKLLQKMENDVEKMIEQGVATKVDGLTVKVKVNEAEMQQTKASNGLNLAKMALCQICGLELDSSILLADEHVEDLNIQTATTQENASIAMQNRPEIESLTLAELATREKIKAEQAEFLPQVALSGNYIVTNPSTTNGFENKFKGMWSVGIQVKVPIWRWREGTYKINMTKAEADIMAYKIEEAKEKIRLQVNQANFKVTEATKQLAMAEKNIEKAEENLRYAQLGFQEGVIPPAQVLEAHTTWFDAQSEKIDAQIEVKLSQVSLQKALGTLQVVK